LRARTIVARIAVVAVATCVGLVAAELLVRAFGPEVNVVFRDQILASDDPVLRYTLRPGAPDDALAISSAGLRDREYDEPKPAGVFRIAAIGDSITFGFGTPRDAGWSKRLEAMLAARAPSATRIEVLNLGVPGYDVEQSVARLRSVGLRFEPDAIVYGYALNDPQGVSIETQALDTLREAFERETSAGLGGWLVHSRLYLLARRAALDRRKPEFLRANPPRDGAFEAQRGGDRVDYFRRLHGEPDGAERLRRGLDALREVAGERDLPVLVLIFPLFGTQHGEGPEALADVHALVGAAARERGFAVIDLLPHYAAATAAFGPKLWLDFMHPNPLGHRVAAVAAADWICANAWPPSRPIECTRDAPLDAADGAVANALSALRP
jgi:lysophospholipase L1-like esterase